MLCRIRDPYVHAWKSDMCMFENSVCACLNPIRASLKADMYMFKIRCVDARIGLFVWVHAGGFEFGRDGRIARHVCAMVRLAFGLV